jgi:hypothetical protein
LPLGIALADNFQYFLEENGASPAASKRIRLRMVLMSGGTFWRARNSEKIVEIELYDEQNDPTETVSIAGRPESRAIFDSLAKHLPPIGSSAVEAKSKGKKKQIQ